MTTAQMIFAALVIGLALIGILLTFTRPLPSAANLDLPGDIARERHDAAAIQEGKCPDCGVASLLEGPSGGMSQNVACNSCLMEFNVHGAFGGRPLGVDRTGKMGMLRAAIFGIQPDEYQDIEDRLYREALS